MLDIGLQIRWIPKSSGGVCAMADEGYIRNLKATLEARIKTDEERTRKENRDADILKAETPKRWAELKAWLKDSIGQLNQGTSELVTCTESLNEIILRCNVGQDRHDFKVTFLDVIGGHIAAKGHKLDLSFEAELDGRKVYWIERGDKHSGLDIEDIGKQILEGVVKA
jgi:hypothetical protein